MRKPSAAAARRAGALTAGLLVVYVMVAGTTPVAARDALLEMPAITTGVMRFGIASALLLTTWLLARRSERLWDIRRGDWGRLAVAAILCVPLNQAFFLYGTQMANSSHAGLFYGLTPVLIFLITLTMGLTRWSLRMGLAALFAFAGAATIALMSYRAGQGPRFLIGDALLFGAVLTWAIYSVVALPLISRYGALRALTLIITVGTLIYLPAVAIDVRELHFAALTPRAWGGFLFISIGASYLNYLLWFVLMTRMDINRMSIAANSSPIVAVIAAHFHHGEPLTPWLLIGGGLILTAITLANWERLRAVLKHNRSHAPPATQPLVESAT